MLKEAIATGETVEIAMQNACRELGVEFSDVEFEILQTPTKKTFGIFGGSPAKVRVYIEVEDEIVEEVKQESVEKAQPAPSQKNQKSAQAAADYIKTVLENMDIKNVQVQIKEEEDNAELVLKGEDIGFIIGYRGETLDALQYLASLVANHSGGKYYRITLDVGNYREKRKDTLQSLGKKMALKSLRTGRNNYLEPMNPYERRIIHTAVQEIDGAKSWSEGEDQARHVVIGPVDGEKFQRNNRRGGYNKNRNNNNRGRSNYNNNRGAGQGQKKPYQKNNYNKNYSNKNNSYNNNSSQRQENSAPKADDPNAPIYGRIDANK